MENKKLDTAFKNMANSYVDTYGAYLKAEREELEKYAVDFAAQGIKPRVQERLKAMRRRKITRGLGIAAACLVVVLLVPAMLQSTFSPSYAPSQVNEAAEAPSTQELREEGITAEDSIEAEGESAQTEYEVIPLSFELPENFSVASVDQDEAKTVYYLDNTQLDDVVMTLEDTVDLSAYDSLDTATINDSVVYYKYSTDYSIMAFEKDGVQYVLTCKYDVNTLADLAQNIL